MKPSLTLVALCSLEDSGRAGALIVRFYYLIFFDIHVGHGSLLPIENEGQGEGKSWSWKLNGKPWLVTTGISTSDRSFPHSRRGCRCCRGRGRDCGFVAKLVIADGKGQAAAVGVVAAEVKSPAPVVVVVAGEIKMAVRAVACSQ